MNDRINMNFPDAQTRARRNVIRGILVELTSHALNIDQAVQAIEHLMIADEEHASGRNRFGNDISGI